MTTTLPLFWHLSSVSKKERLDATVKLIGALEQFQSNFTPKKDVSSGSDDEGGEDEDEDAEAPSKSDGLDLLNVQDVSYSIRRLVRGLASPRESSRLGFAVALTELLSRIETVTCSQIVALILDGSKTQGSMSGQEERDNLFARLFGLTSVIRSGLLIRSGSLVTSASSSAEVSSVSSFEEVIKELVALGEKKSWLRESAWWTVSLAVDALNDSTVPWKKEAPQAVIKQLFMDHDVWSPEKVALALKLQSLYPDQDWRSILSPAFKNPDLLHAGNLQTLARILKESAVEDSEGKEAPKTAATANWKPQLHFVWDVILTQLLPGPNSSHSPKGSFQEFFRIVVDESLFSSTASAERKYWGFQIFQKALPRVNQENMPMLFTKNFMRCWINHLSKQDRYLHKIARQAATDVQTFVQSNPQLGFALILQLTGVHGSQQFDKLTKTKTVESILTSMDSEGVKRYIENLLEKVNGPSSTTSVALSAPHFQNSYDYIREEIHAINSRRSWIIEQLGSLIRSGSIPKEDIWVQTILDWLVVHGLFIIKKKSEKSPFHACLILQLHSVPNPVFSDELHRLSRTKLLACIADLNSQTVVVKTDDKTSKMSAVASDGNFWVSRVLDTINTLVSDTKHVSLQNSLDEDVLVHCTKAQEVTAHLKAGDIQVTDERQEAAKGVQLLLSATVLQQYCADEEDEVDTEALEVCFYLNSLDHILNIPQASIDGATRMFPKGKKGKKARKSAPADESDTVPEPVDLFVDTIIGFLEKSTAYMRTVGNQVFALLSGAVNESTIDLIVTQLERRDPADLLKDEDEDEDMEDVHEDGGSPDTSESEDDTDGDDIGEASDDSNDEEEDVELRKKIEEALRVNGVEAATGDSDEEELMDDEQMMAIDEQLAAVFRMRTNEKKPGKDVDVQREATHFKNRVLDLVDTFAKKQPSSALVVRLIPPLIDIVSGAGQDERQLADKAKGILRSRITKSKETPTDVDPQLISTLFSDIHTRARKVHSSDMLAIFSQCSLYLFRIQAHSHSEQPLIQTYRESLADFLTRKNSALNSHFFQEFFRRHPASAWALRNDILELSGRAINAYRREQAHQLLETLVNQLSAMSDLNLADAAEFTTRLQKTLLQVVEDACDEKINLNAAQLKGIFKLVLVTTRQMQRIDRTWKPESWRSIAERLGSSERFKKSPGLAKMCEQIVRTSNLPNAHKMTDPPNAPPSRAKRKAHDTVDAEDPATAAKKIKRKRVKSDKS
ncbi:hypothetical protein H0H93_007235 [Arthromyces matolae]|nr:hypothetical protein H0H93_007235 [Arthromyces matolae]